jgi:hypothetical protein
VAHGATTTFTVTPATGYSASVTGCGGSLAGTTYTTGAITAACAVTASFSASGDDLTLEDLDVADEQAYQANGTITVRGTVGVLQGGRLILGAGRGIRFQPGFRVQAGGTLSAQIVP